MKLYMFALIALLIGVCVAFPEDQDQELDDDEDQIEEKRYFGPRWQRIVKNLMKDVARLKTQVKALEGRLAGGKEVCRQHVSRWRFGKLLGIVHLNNHPVQCPAGFYLKGFKSVSRRGIRNFRYEYQCCQLNY